MSALYRQEAITAEGERIYPKGTGILGRDRSKPNTCGDVEFCLNNVDSSTRNRLQKRAHERPCLQRCGLCFEGPFLVIDGIVVEGSEHEAMLSVLEDELCTRAKENE